jgi:hypothetical protein
VVEHRPAAQAEPAAQIVPHDPQFALSVAVLAQ